MNLRFLLFVYLFACTVNVKYNIQFRIFVARQHSWNHLMGRSEIIKKSRTSTISVSLIFKHLNKYVIINIQVHSTLTAANQIFDLLMWKNEVLAILVTGLLTCCRAWITIIEITTCFHEFLEILRIKYVYLQEKIRRFVFEKNCENMSWA